MMRQRDPSATPIADAALCGAIGLILGFLLAIFAVLPLLSGGLVP